ncbi:DMT family transporter [Hazenella sp. IB182357]|uniref:DMT family transporter n=1 Tax=Polycladospora coralii TaxID=2771432 RepID=A0A926N972_9BACL|nr:DMT family transporter [Polycladospora coralii]MBD1371697.1 DMT family transporter [Polycladospora coralii]MBS7529164.1 DMT family transporter [Polycladospora coralii]
MGNKEKGIILLLVSAVGFSLMAVFVKLSGDLPTIQKTLFRNLITALIAFGFILYYKKRFFGRRENQKFLFWRSVLGTLGIIFYFYAIDHLVLSDAEMLNKLSPFLLIIFSAVFLKERARTFQVVAILVAFIGTLFIIKPAFSVDLIPYGAGVLSAIFAAGAYTFLRFLGDKENFYTIVFYFSFFSTVILLPFVFWFYEPMSLKQTVYLLLAGTFATVGQLGITAAYKFAPAKEISIFMYATVIYSSIFSFIFFDQLPDRYSITGYLIIFAASLYMFLRNKKGANSH